MVVVIRVNNFDSWWWRDLVSVCGEGQNKMWFTKTELKGQVELYLKVNINEYSEIVCSSKILTKKIKNSN